jgi:hypothetical protein
MKVYRNVFLAGWLTVTAWPAHLSAFTKQASDEVVELRLVAGETFQIDGLKKGAPVHLSKINNRNALVLNQQMPGQIVRVGAEEGNWTISVEMADGRRVTYRITVVSVGRPFSDPLAPGRLPDDYRAHSDHRYLPGGFATPGLVTPRTIEVNP